MGQGGQLGARSFSLQQLLEQWFPFICYLHTLAIGIEFVPIKTKLGLPGILNRLWQSSPLNLLEQVLQMSPPQAHDVIGNHCKTWIVCTFPGIIGVLILEAVY